ncbi:MAG: PTS sugar transporter subunit IIA [Armatimonadetes bacterium]|nr:PTS sugar transporter subunit IIA [Akkermansiaceae bacterium]
MSTKLDIPEFYKSEYLTIGQLASNLGWSTRFIEGLVRGERLPGLEIDGVWHFRRDEVIDWLEQKIQTLDANRVLQLERRVESSLVADGIYQRPVAIDRLTSRMPDDGISLDAHITSKTDVLRALVCLAERTGLLFDRDYLLASLMDREALCSTAMPGGVALCHPRRPIPAAISTQFVCFLRTLKPVDFGSEDGEGTSVFFLLCAPDDRSHLYGLARVARIIHNGALDSLKNAKSEAEVKKAITAVENVINANIG